METYETRPETVEIRDPVPEVRSAPAVRIARRRCPKCGGTAFRVNGSHEDTQGRKIQHCICKACGEKVVFIHE